jgi:transposase InsO family protein
MDNDIVVAAKSCPSCTERLPSHPAEPLLPHAPASRPFEFVFVDLGAYRGRDFLIVADQFSGWPQVFPFPDTNTSTRRVIDALRSFFTCGAGAPVKLWSDGGPQFKSDEFLAFLRDWDISNGRSSPHHPQSNGYAESAVKSMKKLIAGSWSSGSFDPDKFGKALLLFRNAPMSGGASPSQIVFSRPTRDLLPAHRRSFAPKWQQAAELLEKRAQHAKELQIQHFNRSAHPLPPLVIGDSVLIQDHKTKR